MALDQTFDDVSENIINGLMFVFTSKINFIFPTLETRRDRSDGGSVQRGRRKATEFDTSGTIRCDSVLYYCNVLSLLFYSSRRSKNQKEGIQCEATAEF